MVRNWLTILLLVVSYSVGHSQGIKVLTQTQQTGKIGSTLATPIQIQNTSNHLMVIGFSVVTKSLRSSQTAEFCINNDCTAKSIAQPTRVVKLLPGEVFKGFSTKLETGLVPGNSSMKLVFFNMINPTERVETEINFSIAEKRKEDVLYTSNVLELSDVYPNPVVEKAIFKYNFLDPSKKAKIVVLNVLGSAVHQKELSPYETTAIINVDDLNPGVYFYTLYIDDEGVATKKMVVRK